MIEEFENGLADAIKKKDAVSAEYFFTLLNNIPDYNFDSFREKPQHNSFLHLAVANYAPHMFFLIHELLEKNINSEAQNKAKPPVTALDIALDTNCEDWMNALMFSEVKKPVKASPTTTSTAPHTKTESKTATEETKNPEVKREAKAFTITSALRTETKSALASPMAMRSDAATVVNEILKKMPKAHISECECCPQLNRQHGKREDSIRDLADDMLFKNINEQFPVDKYGGPVVLMSIGSGGLKQTATSVASLMKAGRDVEIILVDYDRAAQADLDKQFAELLHQLQRTYNKKATVIGSFSSLEAYKSVILDKPAPVITRFGIPETKSPADQMNAQFKTEHEQYKIKCKKIPHVVTVIDDITDTGGSFIPITGDDCPRYNAEAKEADKSQMQLHQTKRNEFSETLRDYRVLTYQEDIEKELCRIAHATKQRLGVDKIMFVTTEKTNIEPSIGKEGKRIVTLEGKVVTAKNYKSGQTTLGIKTAEQTLESIKLGDPILKETPLPVLAAFQKARPS